MSSYRSGGSNYGNALEGLGGPIRMDPYSLSGIDPCLEDCCRREVESNRRQNALKSTLRRHDIAALAERRRRNLVKTPTFEGCRCCYDPNMDGGSFGHEDYPALVEYKQEHLVPQQQEEPHNANDEEARYNSQIPNKRDKEEEEENKSPNIDNADDDSDDEFDYLLDEDFDAGDEKGNVSSIKELEEQRRAELEYEMLMRQVAIQHGYGTHRQLHPSRVLQVAGLYYNPNISNNQQRLPPPFCVLHLFQPNSRASASLDYYLETKLAPNYPGTMFLTSSGRSTLQLLCNNTNFLKTISATKNSSTDPKDFLPALLAIRDGVIVNTCPKLRGLTNTSSSSSSSSDKDDGGGEIEPYAVEHWLEYCGVLHSQPLRTMEELCFIRPEEEALMKYLVTTTASQQPKDDDADTLRIYDCGLKGCCKTFPHEHVGIKTSEQDGLVVKEETIIGQDK